MNFIEIEHSNDILQDIRNIFSEEVHSLVFITHEVFKKLKKSRGIFRERRCIDTSSHYDKAEVITLERTLNKRAPFCDKTTDMIGLVAETSNLYMILYFYSKYVTIDLTDGRKNSTDHFLATTDKTQRIVILK